MQGINRDKINIHPFSAKCKYYVDVDSCYCCDTCSFTAPNNFEIDQVLLVSLVKNQPQNLKEEAQCIDAMNYCPHEAIHNDGEINNQ